jgi:hypothetical protein
MTRQLKQITRAALGMANIELLRIERGVGP